VQRSTRGRRSTPNFEHFFPQRVERHVNQAASAAASQPAITALPETRALLWESARPSSSATHARAAHTQRAHTHIHRHSPAELDASLGEKAAACKGARGAVAPPRTSSTSSHSGWSDTSIKLPLRRRASLPSRRCRKRARFCGKARARPAAPHTRAQHTHSARTHSTHSTHTPARSKLAVAQLLRRACSGLVGVAAVVAAHILVATTSHSGSPESGLGLMSAQEMWAQPSGAPKWI